MLDLPCHECGHLDSEHHTGAGPIWPCMRPDCDCSDLLIVTPKKEGK